MIILGIETSCDETSAAVVRNGGEVLSNVVHSQIVQHRPYGGVVPEIASRSHVENLPAILATAVQQAGISWNDLDALAVTCGPGLISSLLIGHTAARALSLALHKPLLGINHLEAHISALFLQSPPLTPREICPLLVLLVSGGHTCLVEMRAMGDYRLLGQTLDDAAGEALDKGANLLGLGYPGGPVMEKTGRSGRPDFVAFPRGMEHRRSPHVPPGLHPDYCFSYSGLKTALLYYLRDHPAALPEHLADLAASYQEAVVDALVLRAERALQTLRPRMLACVGGVARNQRLRLKLEAAAHRAHVQMLFAQPDYCTDNAAMVAAAAAWRIQTGIADLQAPLPEAQPSLPLTHMNA